MFAAESRNLLAGVGRIENTARMEKVFWDLLVHRETSSGFTLRTEGENTFPAIDI